MLKFLFFYNGIIIWYDDNTAVISDQEGNRKGTRIF